MSMLGCSTGSAVAEEVIMFIRHGIALKLNRPLTEQDMLVLQPVLAKLEEIKQACDSGWY